MAGVLTDAALVFQNAFNAAQMIADIYEKLALLKDKHELLTELFDAADYEIDLTKDSGLLRNSVEIDDTMAELRQLETQFKDLDTQSLIDNLINVYGQPPNQNKIELELDKNQQKAELVFDQVSRFNHIEEQLGLSETDKQLMTLAVQRAPQVESDLLGMLYGGSGVNPPPEGPEGAESSQVIVSKESLINKIKQLEQESRDTGGLMTWKLPLGRIIDPDDADEDDLNDGQSRQSVMRTSPIEVVGKMLDDQFWVASFQYINNYIAQNYGQALTDPMTTFFYAAYDKARISTALDQLEKLFTDTRAFLTQVNLITTSFILFHHIMNLDSQRDA
jgi:hypothetical protein